MSGEEAGPEKRQNQINTRHMEARMLRAWYRAVGLSEDEIARLIHEPAADEESTVVRARRE
jgi:hypothetical protein